MQQAHYFGINDISNTQKYSIGDWVTPQSNTYISPMQQILHLSQMRINGLEGHVRQKDVELSKSAEISNDFMAQITKLKEENSRLNGQLNECTEQIERITAQNNRLYDMKKRLNSFAREVYFETLFDDGEESLLDDDTVSSNSVQLPPLPTPQLPLADDGDDMEEDQQMIEDEYYANPSTKKVFKPTQTSSSEYDSTYESESDDDDERDERDEETFPEKDISNVRAYVKQIKKRYKEENYIPPTETMKKDIKKDALNTNTTTWTLSRNKEYAGNNNWTAKEDELYKKKADYYLKHKEEWPGWGLFSISFPEKTGQLCAIRFKKLYNKKSPLNLTKIKKMIRKREEKERERKRKRKREDDDESSDESSDGSEYEMPKRKRQKTA